MPKIIQIFILMPFFFKISAINFSILLGSA